MARSTFKTMYLVSKSDLENRNDRKAKKNFKLSLQNRDICDGGMSVSVKPIKTRVRNKQNIEKLTNVQLDATDSEDGNENILAMQQYPNAGFKVQSTESNPGLKSGNHFKNPNDDADDDSNDDWDKTHDTDFEKSSSLNMVEGPDLSNNEDGSSHSNVGNYNNHYQKDNVSDSNPSNIEDHNNNDTNEQIGQRHKRIKHAEKRKGYKIKRLQKSYSKMFNRKFVDNKKLQRTSHSEDIPLNQYNNNLMLQYENRDSSKGEDNQKRYINEEHETEEVDDNQINKSVPNLKKRKILDDVQKIKDDQWLGRIKSRLNDKRVQFKRKRDNIGYRINPDDISKSLIKPSDFTYLNQTDSADYLDKWKSLKELRKKPFKNKRFKPYLKSI